MFACLREFVCLLDCLLDVGDVFASLCVCLYECVACLLVSLFTCACAFVRLVACSLVCLVARLVAEFFACSFAC